MRDDKQ